MRLKYTIISNFVTSTDGKSSENVYLFFIFFIIRFTVSLFIRCPSTVIGFASINYLVKRSDVLKVQGFKELRRSPKSKENLRTSPRGTSNKTVFPADVCLRFYNLPPFHDYYHNLLTSSPITYPRLPPSPVYRYSHHHHQGKSPLFSLNSSVSKENGFRPFVLRFNKPLIFRHARVDRPNRALHSATPHPAIPLSAAIKRFCQIQTRVRIKEL